MGRAPPLPLSLRNTDTERRFVSHPTLLLLSLVTIIALLQNPPKTHTPQATLATPSLFRARADCSTYAQARRYENYTWGRVCSDQARSRFLRRFGEPSRPLGLHKAPLTLEQARGRVLVSHIPLEVGDGLGHRMCILNYELHLTMQLGVAYSHRVSTYGSLTREDPDAVERLFGWGADEIRRDEILKSACSRFVRVNDSCENPSESILCGRLHPRHESIGTFDQAVFIPHELAECYLSREEGRDIIDEKCYALVRRFIAAFPEPNTLFLLRPRLCFRDYLYPNFSKTHSWFHDKYWTSHKRDGVSDIPVQDKILEVGAHKLTYDPNRVHIALHVRRGDFFNYTSRVLISDATFADMAARVVVALHEIMDSNVPITVHVYSEGVPNKSERLKDNHDISTMEKVYASELGERMPPKHWDNLIHRHTRLSAARGVGRGVAPPNVNVEMHIATDTIQSLHEMLAADFFVGSISGLSAQVVRYLGRGVIMLPIALDELMPTERTIAFDFERNGIPSFVDEKLLYERVALYARENRLACSVW